MLQHTPRAIFDGCLSASVNDSGAEYRARRLLTAGDREWGENNRSDFSACHSAESGKLCFIFLCTMKDRTK